MKENRKRKALFSISDKDRAEVLGTYLEQSGWEIYATRGTCDALKKGGVKNPIDIVDIGVPTMLNHLVATLHPNIHAAVLCQDTPEHDAEMANMPVDRFDLVYCIPYDFEKTYMVASTTGRTPESAEEVRLAEDVGAMSLIQGASKSGRIILHSKSQVDSVIKVLENRTEHDSKWLASLAAKARAFLANYLYMIHCFDTGRAEGLWD